MADWIAAIGQRTRNPGFVEHNHQNPAPVAIGIDAIGSGKESGAGRLDVCIGKFDQDASFIASRRNSLRGIGDAGESISSDSLFLCERDEHLLMIAVARNRIRGLEERFSDRRIFVVEATASLRTRALSPSEETRWAETRVRVKVLWSSPCEASIFERTRAWSPSEEMELAASK